MFFGRFKDHFVELWVSVWRVWGGFFGVFGELLGSFCGALGVTLRSFGDLGGYRACPKGGEAPVGAAGRGEAPRERGGAKPPAGAGVCVKINLHVKYHV